MKRRTKKKRSARARSLIYGLRRRNHGRHDRWELLAGALENPWLYAADAANVFGIAMKYISGRSRIHG